MLNLTIACRPYDRVLSLQTGATTVEGCEINFLPLSAEEIFSRAYSRAEFDVTELSMSSHIITTERHISNYVGLPIFISRMFRHSAIYIRTDRGIKMPQDLQGKVVGVPEYQMTAALWARGMLSDVYGVRAETIKWRTGGLLRPGRVEKFGLHYDAPLDVQSIPSDETLNSLLAAGEIDGVISAREPTAFRGNPHVGRLFKDYVSEEKRYFRSTGLFPIMHLIGVRRDVVERYPWVPTSLLKAFSQAKSRCLANMEDANALQVTLPWLLEHYAEARAILGPDYWPYGFESNRVALETMLRYSREQGLTKEQLRPEALFTPCDEVIASA